MSVRQEDKALQIQHYNSQYDLYTKQAPENRCSQRLSGA